MPDVEDSASPAVEAFGCPRCASTRLRRSAPRGPGERLARALLPVHFFRCRSCGHRGWHWGRLRRRRPRRSPQPSGRPVERRDGEAQRTRRARLLLAVAVAIGLGVAAGIGVQSCQQRVVRPGGRAP